VKDLWYDNKHKSSLFSSKIKSSWSTNGMPLSRMLKILYKLELMIENSSEFEGHLEMETENCS
jgi:hypothetical protein